MDPWDTMADQKLLVHESPFQSGAETSRESSRRLLQEDEIALPGPSKTSSKPVLVSNSSSIPQSSHTSSEEHVKDVTDIIGKYGPWQRFIFILTCLRGIPTAFFNLSTPFFAPKMDVWCARPSNMLLNLTSEEWRNISIPLEADDKHELRYSRCKMYEVTVINSEEIVVNRNKTIFCSNWEYDNSFYSSTILQQYDLVCKNDWMISFTQFIYMAGMLVGVFVFGHLADRFGRKIILNLSVTLMVVAGVITAFSVNFTMFNIARFSLALGVAGTQNSSFCLLMEILGPEYRTRVTFAFSFGWAFGLLLLPGMAYLIRDWMYLQLFSTLITSVLLCYWCFMPESPRWLITQGKYEKAEEVMLVATKKNKIKVNGMSRMIAQLKDVVEQEARKKNPNILDLFKTSNLRKNTIFVYIVYFSSGFVFYGFLLSQTTFDGNPFLNFFIGSAVEIPAYILSLFFVKYLCRRTSMLIFCITAAVACFLIIPTHADYKWIRLTAAIIGKLSISGAFLIIGIHAAEIFPTVVRTVGSGTSLMMGRLGAMTAPFVKEIGLATHEVVPPIIFGVLSVLAALFVLLLPETHNQHLTDTIQEAEKLGKLHNGDGNLLESSRRKPQEENGIALTSIGRNRC